jgi:hypothetical protein
VEHKECMRYLWKNMKTYFGPLFSQNIWADAKARTIDRFDYHMRKIEEKSPNVIA